MNVEIAKAYNLVISKCDAIGADEIKEAFEAYLDLLDKLERDKDENHQETIIELQEMIEQLECDLHKD